jgi:hypothetical protein
MAWLLGVAVSIAAFVGIWAVFLLVAGTAGRIFWKPPTIGDGDEPSGNIR